MLTLIYPTLFKERQLIIIVNVIGLSLQIDDDYSISYCLPIIALNLRQHIYKLDRSFQTVVKCHTQRICHPT